MKKKALLIFAITSLLLALTLFPMVGCNTKTVGNSNPSTSSSSDTSWEPRVKSLETRMGTAEGELETIPDDINIYTLVTDLQDQIDALIAENATLSDEIAALKLRLDALEQEAEEEEAEEEEPPLSGEVTAEIITQDEQPPIFTSGVTATNQTFPVKITNGTDEYQKVTFSVILRCTSTDYKADVDAGFTMTMSSVSFTSTPVPGLTGCQMIYFVWTSTDSIPVAPGKEVSVYVMLNGFTTTSGWEIWEVVLGDITAKPL